MRYNLNRDFCAYMERLGRYIYCLLLAFVSMGCSDAIDLGQPRIDVNNFNVDSQYIIVVGDIQEYTYNESLHPYLEYTMQWIYNAIDADMAVNSVLLVGDVTSENRRGEWRVFSRYTEPVARKVPFVACIGNHDYEWNNKSEIEDRDDTHFSKYLSFDKAKAQVVDRYKKDRWENVVVRNKIFDEYYDILVLEFGARDEVLTWANNHVKANLDKRFILLTHEFLGRDGEIIGKDSYAEKQLRNTSWNSPQHVWDKLVKCNNNILCVLCGHNGFSKMRLATNEAGREVPQILFNLQYQENGGDGMIEIWEAAQNSDSISVGIYNTLKNEWVDGLDTSFKFRYKY